MRRSVLVGLLVLVVGLAVAAPGGATAPSSEAFSFSTADSINCGGYEVLLVRTIAGTEATYFDNAGSPVRVQVVARMQGSVTNSKTGTVLGLRGNLLVVIDLVTGTQAWDGQVFMSNGAVIQDTGRFLVDADGNVLLEAGPHDAIDQGEAAFCSAVA